MSSDDSEGFLIDEPNPYAAPDADVTRPDGGHGEEISDAEAIRRAHLTHEASIQSVGSLYLLGAIFLVVAIIGLAAAAANAQDPQQRMVLGGLAAFYVFVCALNIALGIGLRRLQNWARWTDVVIIGFSSLYLLVNGILIAIGGVPPQLAPMVTAPVILGGYAFVGLINGYILYLLLAAKAAMIFSPFYQDVIAQTPHVKYKTSCIVKVAVGLFLAIVALGIVGGIIGLLSKR